MQSPARRGVLLFSQYHYLKCLYESNINRRSPVKFHFPRNDGRKSRKPKSEEAVVKALAARSRSLDAISEKRSDSGMPRQAFRLTSLSRRSIQTRYRSSSQRDCHKKEKTSLAVNVSAGLPVKVSMRQRSRSLRQKASRWPRVEFQRNRIGANKEFTCSQYKRLRLLQSLAPYLFAECGPSLSRSAGGTTAGAPCS